MFGVRATALIGAPGGKKPPIGRQLSLIPDQSVPSTHQTGIDAPVVARDEEVQDVRHARQRADRRTDREHAANRAPVVVDSRPVSALDPPTRVDAAVVAHDEEVQDVRHRGPAR